MNEILFRAKRIDNNDWIVGSLIVEPHRVRVFVPHNEKSSTCVEVHRDTVQQYVWTKDKHGERVFEGDIYKQQQYYCGNRNGNRFKEVLPIKKMLMNDSTNWELVGNTIDNAKS